MMNARRNAGLIEEHLDELFLGREVWVQPLHRDEALEAADPGQAREVHRRHATRRDLAHELIAIDALTPRAGVEEFRHSARTFRAPRRSPRNQSPATAEC